MQACNFFCHFRFLLVFGDSSCHYQMKLELMYDSKCHSKTGPADREIANSTLRKKFNRVNGRDSSYLSGSSRPSWTSQFPLPARGVDINSMHWKFGTNFDSTFNLISIVQTLTYFLTET